MFTITDRAAEKAKDILSAEGKSGWGLRVYMIGGGCCGPSFGLDIEEGPSPGDEVFEKNGLRVFVDKNTSLSITQMTLDYYEDEEREGFVLSGGQAPSCGLGCSSC